MHVEYGFEPLQNCQCSACAVHNESSCIMEKTHGLKFTHCSSTPDPEEVEAIYCSAQKGKSSCPDLATDKACMCPTCNVWRSYDLETAYFCSRGAPSS
jgi:hypothetical protein